VEATEERIEQIHLNGEKEMSRELLKKIKDMLNTMPFQSIGSLNVIKEIEAELAKPFKEYFSITDYDEKLRDENKALRQSLQEMRHLALAYVRYHGGMSDGSDDEALKRAADLLKKQPEAPA
jgi:hypothetical protein